MNSEKKKGFIKASHVLASSATVGGKVDKQRERGFGFPTIMHILIKLSVKQR